MTFKTSRRVFLQGTLGAALGGSALAACSSGASGGSGADAEANANVTLPDYLPYEGVTPDLPGNAEGLANAFFTYPAERPQASATPPGDGSAISALVESPLPTPPGKSANEFWQHINEIANVDLNLTIVPTADWETKFATSIAGGDLPDLTEIWTPPQRSDMMPALFAELGDYIAGDKIADYPNLANIETVSWQQCVFEGGIYGTPVPRGAMSSEIMFRRDDLVAALGLNPDPGNFEEFVTLCQDLTDPRTNSWALGGMPHSILQQMLGLPNGWSLEGGEFANAIERPEMKEAIAAAARLWELGVIHPDSFSANVGPLRKQWFNAGTVTLVTDTYPAWPGYYRENVAGDSFDVGAMILPGFDGHEVVTWRGNPTHNITAIRKDAGPERVELLLRFIDWLSAPFGTEEHLAINNGIEGTHFDFVDGEPIRTAQGNAEIALALGYLGAGPQAFYQAGLPNVSQKQYDHQGWMIERAVSNPTLGLISDTNASKGEQLWKTLYDVRDAIVQGREPIESWDEAVTRFKSNGGDTIRDEYQAAYEASGR
ncbi:extracellular solute-binding protein [Occultella kanbiaonis]|uniref:extracellular solute-binding protein n=1 Tax=Occultella kanbiaonis TaxID=2675754 RepID=UPI0013D3DBD6|nr:extracellular solute-binding protein [Occultella kanbiaonis]